LVLHIRYTRTQSGPRYLSSTAVIMSELIKAFTAGGILLFQNNPAEPWSTVFGEDFINLAIPAGIYAIQNNLLYYGLSNLEAPVYQVSNQLKVFTTAIFFVILLQQYISIRKWFALVMLFVGVSLVQVNSLADSKSPETATSSPSSEHPPQNIILGVLAVFLASVTSGYAGVYFEKILKSTTSSVWVRNIQLGSFGFLFAGIITLLFDFNELRQKGFFYGWNLNVFLLVCNHAIGGLIVAVVVKYADNILKGFASSISIILSSIFSVYLFGFKLSWLFVLGTALVLIACYLYQQPESPRSSEKPMV